MISYDLPFAHKRFQEEHGLSHVAGLSAIRHAGFGENYGDTTRFAIRLANRFPTD
jgi:peroxiredoxin